MKIAVYAISKNEAQFVSRWVESMQEADEIYVLDTGSTDGTPELLEALGVHVTQETISPWRFDVARNRALDMVPDDVDICVSTDLDEVLHPGWRTVLEKSWLPWTQQAYFRYTWAFTPDGEEAVVFQREKIHARKNFQWTHPVHEVLEYTGEDNPVVVYIPELQLDHFPDPSKSRGQYLPLLELSVKEDPLDDRNRHYLGREYFFYGRWMDCICTLKAHLALPTATWKDERASSMNYIAKSYLQLGDLDSATQWHMRACAEAPHLRETWMSWAETAYAAEQWNTVLFACTKALEIHNRPLSYISDSRFWSSLPYDLGALAAYHLGLYRLAVQFGKTAAELCPKDARLAQNLRYYQAAAQ